MAVLAQARRVTKRFGAQTAVDAVDLAVATGEVVGLLGANGAGKTTLIRLLLGLLEPSRGEVLLFGQAPSVRGRRRVGYVPQTLGLYDDMTVQENWAFAAAAFRSGRPPMPESVQALRDELVGSLPLGSQRLVAFAVAFSHNPELLVLDEPTSGVGPLNGARLWQRIRDSAGDGMGVLVTTHNMEEAEQCDRLVVMADGRVITEGTVAAIIGDRQVTEVRCADWQRAFHALDARGLSVQLQGDVLRVPSPARDIEAALSGEGLTASIGRVPANLDEAFIAMVSGTAAGPRDGGAQPLRRA